MVPETLSVIVPSWNGVKLLPTCLNSLRAQTYRHFEVLIVDNASTDESVVLILSLIHISEPTRPY